MSREKEVIFLIGYFWSGTPEDVQMSEAEVARDLHAVLAKVQQGVEIVIEQDDRPVAVLKPSKPMLSILSSRRVKGIREENRHEAAESGGLVGGEVW